MNKFILVLFLSLGLWACQGGQTDQSASSTPSATPSAEAPADNTTASANAGTATYPSIPAEKVKMLWDNCDYVDFVFYYLNFSMSQKVQNSIRQTIAHISTEVPLIDPNCQPIGRLFFQSQGKNISEADIFYSNGCAYFVFYEDGKYAYANKMHPNGTKFYDNIFKQVQAQKQ